MGMIRQPLPRILNLGVTGIGVFPREFFSPRRIPQLWESQGRLKAILS